MYNLRTFIWWLKATPIQACIGCQDIQALSSKKSAHWDSQFVSPVHQLPLPPWHISLVLISVRSWVDHRNIVQSEGLSQWKISMTPSGIKTTTFQLVVQCLNQLRHHIFPIWWLYKQYNLALVQETGPWVLEITVEFPAQARNFSLLQSVQTSYRPHPASYSKIVGVVFFPGGKAYHSPPSSAEVTNK
jgi:hypothetical protein